MPSPTNDPWAPSPGGPNRIRRIIWTARTVTAIAIATGAVAGAVKAIVDLL